MNNIPSSIVLLSLAMIFIITACGVPVTPTSQPETEAPTPPPSPTETAITIPTPTEPLATASATLEYAPLCEPGAASIPTPASCRVPMAEESTTFCTRKIPYNLIFVNEGATYEVLNKGFTCSDAGVKDGRQMVTCTGPMASAFRVKVCDPACAIPTIQAEITQCPLGYAYNNQQGCCSQELLVSDQNCELLTLKTKSCVVDCSLYTKKAACNKNAIACEWNSASKTCQLRR